MYTCIYIYIYLSNLSLEAKSCIFIAIACGGAGLAGDNLIMEQTIEIVIIIIEYQTKESIWNNYK